MTTHDHTAHSPAASPAPGVPGGVGPATSARRARWKTPVAVSVALLVGVVLGAAGSNSDEVQNQLRAAELSLQSAEAENATLSADLDQMQSDNGSMAEQLDEAEARADGAVEAARATAKKEFADRAADLDTRDRDLKRRSAALDRRERKVTGVERSWDANTIPGDGIFVVGADVTPGVYKADPAPSGSCYFARLAGIGGDNIIDNNNVSGPVVLTVAPSDGSLELSGCADFHKIG